jgi:surface carbohydrate biosynthesis protein (TIGR04326 family)
VISSFAQPGALWRAFRNWRLLQRVLPRLVQLIERPTQSSTQVFADVMTRCITESFYGTIAARTALYTELFTRALHAAPDAKVVVYPFEGQGWESTLEQAAARRGIATLPYLHTVMKPWDLRAHAALRECAPAGVWVHGPHDEAELVRHGVALHRVEALRYQYLGAARNPSFTRVEGELQRVGQQILVTLGADCERSQAEMIAFCEAAQRLQPTWKLHVRLHPQCLAVQVPVGDNITTSRGSLSDDLAQCTSAFLCGTAAPLDSYLFGLPTAALRMSDGFDMNPLEADECFAYVDTADEAVQWLATAVQSTKAKPEIAKFFDIANELPKWHSFVRSLTR